MSSTVRAMGPTSQMLGGPNAPLESIRPCVGFRPAIQQFDAGCRTEPPASVPNAAGQMPLATATADPLLDPIASCVGLHGFRGGGRRSSSPGMLQANSLRFSLASTMAPARRVAAIAGASFSGTQSASTRELAVVRRPAVAMQSLTPTGMPCSGPRHLP